MVDNMTHELVIADLPDYEQITSPIKSLEQLNKTYDESYDLNIANFSSGLDQIGRKIGGYICQRIRPETDDGYHWFWSLHFRRPSSLALYILSKALGIDGEIAVLFPWAQDFDNPESRLDRSIGVYTKGGIIPEEVEKLLLDINRLL